MFVLLAILSFRQVSSLDVGFHLKTGEYILSHHAPPRTDPFTYTLHDRAYINLSWGYDLILAVIQGRFGAPGLVVLHAMLVLGIFWLVYRTARIGPAEPTVLVWLLLAGVVASEIRFEVRPELLSYFFLALVLHLLHRHAEGLSSPLWALPIVHLLWANTHSLFILGWAVQACFLIGLFLRRFSLDRRLLLWGAGSVGAALVNPYGWRGFAFPITLATRLQKGNVFAQSIGEFTSPFDLEISQRFPFYPRLSIFAFRALLVLSVPALLWLLRQKRFWCALLWLASVGLAYKMIRNLPIFVIVALPGIAWGFPAGRMLESIGLGADRRRGLARAGLACGAAVALVLGMRVVNDAYYIGSRRVERFGWGWNGLSLPLGAVRYADAAGLRGRVLNHLNFGGWLMWARPDPVFIDGRLEVVGEDFYNAYRRALSSESELESCVARYGIGWLVFPYPAFPDLLGRVSKDPRWRLSHVDGLAAAFVREGPEAKRFLDPGLAGALASPVGAPPLRSLPGLDGKARPGRVVRWVRGLIRRERFPADDFNLGLFHIYRGEYAQARARFARAIASSGGAYYEIYSNLGAALYRSGQLAEARDCYRIVLEEKPDDRLARQRLGAIDGGPSGR